MFNHQVDYELEKTKKKFREYYNNELKRKYAELELIRQKYLWKFICSLILSGIGVYSIFFFMYGKENDVYMNEYIILMFLIMYLFLAGYSCFYFSNTYKEDTKGIVWNEILPFWSNFQKGRITDLRITQNVIDNSLLFGYIDERHTDDCFCGFYKGVPISIEELKLISKKEIVDIPSYIYNFFWSSFWGLINLFIGKNKTEYERTCFSGLLFYIKIFKNIDKEVLVLEKTTNVSDFKNNWMIFLWMPLLICSFAFCCFLFYNVSKINCYDWQLLGLFFVLFKYGLFFVCLALFYYLCTSLFAWWKNLATRHDMMEKVNLEDVDFSENWEVRADDQVEARYVLTPALMERMLAVKKLFHGNRIDFSFWGNNLLIAVHTNKDMFETTSLFKSALDYRKVEEVICQLYSIFMVIDTLKLQNESKNKS